MELLNEIQVSFPRFYDNELDIYSKFIFLMSQEHRSKTPKPRFQVAKTRNEPLHPN